MSLTWLCLLENQISVSRLWWDGELARELVEVKVLALEAVIPIVISLKLDLIKGQQENGKLTFASRGRLCTAPTMGGAFG